MLVSSLLEGTESLHGNHEDIHVVEKLHRGEIVLKNLHILDHWRGYRVGPAFVYGLGGNLLPGSKMLQRPLSGGAGKIWSTLTQYRELVELADEAGQARPGQESSSPMSVRERSLSWSWLPRAHARI
jgi:hypothetical protein